MNRCFCGKDHRPTAAYGGWCCPDSLEAVRLDRARFEVIGYRVDPKDERVRGEAIVLCPGPFTHAEAATAISKFTKRPTFAITVREVA